MSGAVGAAGTEPRPSAAPKGNTTASHGAREDCPRVFLRAEGRPLGRPRTLSYRFSFFFPFPPTPCTKRQQSNDAGASPVFGLRDETGPK